MKILALFLSLFICKFTFSQLDSNKFRLSIGANVHADMFNMDEFIPLGNGQHLYYHDVNYGGGFDVRFNCQNRFMMSSFLVSFNQYPIQPLMMLMTELRQSFNFNFRNTEGKTFVGPFASIGYNFSLNKFSNLNFSEKLVSNIGLVYSRKYFQIEVSKMFRKKSFEHYSYDRFIWGYTFSMGVKIPLKKIQKK